MRFIPQRHRSARLPLAVAAAVVVAMVGGCTSGPTGGVGAAPTVSPEPPASTPVATPRAWSPEGDFFVAVTIDLPQEGIWTPYTTSPEQAGVFSSPGEAWFSVTTTVRVAEDPCARGGESDLPEVGPGVPELVDALAATPIASEVEETSVAGHPAWLITFAADDSSQLCEDGGYRLWRWNNNHADGLELGWETRAWVVDVDGTRVLLVADDRGTPEQSAALQRMLDSIQLSGR
jgi:hypothetical protein